MGMEASAVRSVVRQAYEKLAAEAQARCHQQRNGAQVIVQIGSATCEHAAGSLEVWDEFKKHVVASGRQDILLHRTGCTGRCTREPIVGILSPGRMPVKYQQVNRELVHRIFTQHVQKGEPVVEHILDDSHAGLGAQELLVCRGLRCGGPGRELCEKVLPGLLQEAGLTESQIRVSSVSCFGACYSRLGGKCTHVLVRPSNVLYQISQEQDAREIIQEHLVGGRVVDRLVVQEGSVSQQFFQLYGDTAFFQRQIRIALRNCGVIDPESLDEYICHGGFRALAQVLDRGDAKWVVEEIRSSRLRGRGGAGFPTGEKWAFAAAQRDPTRYIICNADEGDPGAFMDRSMLESDPFNVLEGMMIGGYAIGALQGFLYIRAEYPMAVHRVQKAIDLCRAHGLLGKSILNSGFDFELEIRLGAGAFVCGEETALIHSIEGERGQPRIRPPYPTEEGLWGKPTVINNVETFANVPAIIQYGAEWFRRIGASQSGGTKVFALAGKAEHTGLVEVPLGITLREVIFDIGGGPQNKNVKIKAVQTGGPAGGCIPAEKFDLPIDFDSLSQAGSIMGSGGMIVLDEEDCMVDIAKFFVAFSVDESCGKCTPCREGTLRMLEILERITTGQGTVADLEKLERLGKLLKKASLCGLGRAAPNPVLSTLTYFRDEYIAHVTERRCPSKKCVALLQYIINPQKCIGCTVCAKNCPVTCISGERRQPHVIDPARCIKCGKCFEVCKFDAVQRR